MTIRLTSPGAFDKVLEKLKKDPMYDEEINAPFFKYCVDDIREGVARGYDEWYLDIAWRLKSTDYKIALVIRYYKRSHVQTDEEYLNENENEEETKRN